MNLNELRAQHPDVYEAAVKAGVDQERDRVSAHLTMGEASGDMKTAVDAVKKGDGMTATLQAQYLAAGMNRRDQDSRQEDDLAAAGADGADKGGEGKDAADLVCGAVESALGIVGEQRNA